MRTGYSCICKPCHRADSRKRELERRSTPEGLEKDKARHREKYRRLGKNKSSPEKQALYVSNYLRKYPEKDKIQRLTSNLRPVTKGNQLHHWSYNQEHAKDVFEFTRQQHATIHRFIQYDTETFMYKDLEGNLLNTRQKHEKYINQFI